ncbi:MAG: PAS domain S-box protein, partial [Pseudanabaenaceae cyanobacterium]
MKAPLPTNEAIRLIALKQCNVLDTPPEPEFDDLVQAAAALCEVPVALISLVDETRQWFKAKLGLTPSETPRDVAFCAHAILQSDVMVVEDARQDPRFADNPLVTGEPWIRFYAGVPLTTTANLNLGTLCVIDFVPRTLTSERLVGLQALARQVTRQLERRRRSHSAAPPSLLGPQNPVPRSPWWQWLVLTSAGVLAGVLAFGAFQSRQEIAQLNQRLVQKEDQYDQRVELFSALQVMSALRDRLRQGDTTVLETYVATARTLRQALVPDPQMGLIAENLHRELQLAETVGRLQAAGEAEAALNQARTNGTTTLSLAEVLRQSQQRQQQLQENTRLLAALQRQHTVTLGVTSALSLVTLVGVWMLLQREKGLRQQVGRTLQQEQDLNTFLLENATFLVIALDEQGRVVRWNHSCELLTGYTFAEVRDRPLWELPVAIDPMAAARLRDCSSDFVPYETTFAVRDGNQRTVRWHWQTLQDGQGAVLCFLVTGTDITAQQQLEAERQQFVSLVQRSNDVVALTNRAGQLLFLNDGGRRLLGFAATDPLPKRLVDLYEEADGLSLQETIL